MPLADLPRFRSIDLFVDFADQLVASMLNWRKAAALGCGNCIERLKDVGHFRSPCG